MQKRRVFEGPLLESISLFDIFFMFARRLIFRNCPYQSPRSLGGKA